MALLDKLFGSGKALPDNDPLAGEGGYTGARGKYGEHGFPGSTGSRRTNPSEASGALHDGPAGFAEADASRHADFVEGSRNPPPEFGESAVSPPGREHSPRRGSTPDIRQPSPQEQQADLQKEATEWFGGPNREIGTSELGPDHGLGSARNTQVQQTLGFEGTPGISRGIPGDQYGKPHGPQFFKGQAAAPDGENRFVFGGRNGGVSSTTFDRRMPFTSRGNGARGADLNGTRYYGDVAAQEYFGDQGGSYGYGREIPNGQHRPTEFYEPGPWTENFYDTTETAGSPGEGAAPMARNMVYVSPEVSGRRRS